MQKSRPEWMDAALQRHVKPAEVAKERATRARLQAALRSDNPAERAAAKAEVNARTKNPGRTPSAPDPGGSGTVPAPPRKRAGTS